MTSIDDIVRSINDYKDDAVTNAVTPLNATIIQLNRELADLKAQLDPAVLPYWGAPVWRDEFDGAAIDPKKWNVRERADLGLTIDAAIPNKANVTVKDGIAHLKGTWLPDAPKLRTPSATGVAILTHNTGYMDHRALKPGNVSYGQRYGRWEIRAKVPTGPNTLGALAAFWLRNGKSGEVDIMESWGYGAKPATGQAPVDGSRLTVHSTTAGGGLKKFWNAPKSEPVWEDFHTWALEWTPEYFRAYIDGERFVNETPASTPWLWDTRYFSGPNHVRLNLHVGPDPKYWGLPDPKNKKLTQDPLDFQVDYVRIWELPA